jgi:hypothetical protein
MTPIIRPEAPIQNIQITTLSLPTRRIQTPLRPITNTIPQKVTYALSTLTTVT